MRIVAIIPARYKSTRFEGKPLAEIQGKPMIWWVYQQAKKVREISQVYVATDDTRIYDACVKHGMEVCMTEETHLTGTDRVAEVASRIPADIYLNIQGDEPLIEPEVIYEAIKPILENNMVKITNLMTQITEPVDLINSTVPKVITNSDNYAIYLTRSPAPYPKGDLNVKYYKQVCVYGYTPEELLFFADFGKRVGKAKIEKIEDIELLRFIENAHPVKFIEVKSRSVAVDTLKDLERVKQVMEGGIDK